MESLTSIIDKYIEISKLKRDLEKTNIFDDNFKNKKKKELERLNIVLDNIHIKFDNKVQSMSQEERKIACNIIEFNLSKIKKETSNLKQSICSLSKIENSNDNNNNELMRYSELNSEKIILLEDKNEESKTYEMFLNYLNQKLDTKVYEKAI